MPYLYISTTIVPTEQSPPLREHAGGTSTCRIIYEAIRGAEPKQRSGFGSMPRESARLQRTRSRASVDCCKGQYLGLSNPVRGTVRTISYVRIRRSIGSAVIRESGLANIRYDSRAAASQNPEFLKRRQPTVSVASPGAPVPRILLTMSKLHEWPSRGLIHP